jgi:hypothetical protein
MVEVSDRFMCVSYDILLMIDCEAMVQLEILTENCQMAKDDFTSYFIFYGMPMFSIVSLIALRLINYLFFDNMILVDYFHLLALFFNFYFCRWLGN